MKSSFCWALAGAAINPEMTIKSARMEVSSAANAAMLPSSNHPVNVTLPSEIAALLRRGTVIPAYPLALDARRKLDERRQRPLARYHPDADRGVPPVGLQATQFAIREAGL